MDQELSKSAAAASGEFQRSPKDPRRFFYSSYDQVISDRASSDHVINEFCGMDCDNYPEATSFNNYCGFEVILMRPQHDLPLLGRKQEQTASIKDQI